MIDYEEVVEAIWRYDCPRIDIDEDITTLYADGKPFAQVIHRADGSREDLYFEDYELQKGTLIKPNATLRDVVELCMNGDISYADAREWCIENDISLGQMAHLGFIIPTLANDICKPIRQSMRNNYRKDYLK